ncbi:hypothetical protein BGZ99_001295, partial [Dissophora globulifera]
MELIEPIRSDHKLVATTFDLHTLIDPSRNQTEKAHRNKRKKILYDEATDEEWSDFRHQIESKLPEFGRLDTMGLGGLQESLDQQEYTATQELLETLPLDQVWETLQEFIMSAAIANLPCVKSGGAQKPKGEAGLQAKTSDLGKIIHAIRTRFL